MNQQINFKNHHLFLVKVSVKPHFHWLDSPFPRKKDFDIFFLKRKLTSLEAISFASSFPFFFFFSFLLLTGIRLSNQYSSF